MCVLKVWFRFGLMLLVCCFFPNMRDVCAGNVLLSNVGQEEDIKDVVIIGTDTLEACINQKVKLTCDKSIVDKDVLSYEWWDKSTGKLVGTTRDVMVEPKATTTYQLLVKYVLPGDERIVNGDFERGENDCYNAGTAWSPEWKCRSFESQYKYIKSNSWNSMEPEGTCKIVKDTRVNHPTFMRITDHTKKNWTGYMLVANGDFVSSRDRIVWQTTITGIVPGRQYAFSVWAANISSKNAPMLDFTINQKGLGGIFDGYRPKPNGKWEQLYKIWTADDKQAVIALVNKLRIQNGNDFCIDDISFAPVVLGVGEVEVKILPQIAVEKLSDLNVCEGADLTVNANVIGSNITKYEWTRKRDGVKISDTERMTVTNADILRDAGEYSLAVTGVCGSQSADFALTVNERLRNRGVKIDTVSVCMNETATLSAARITGAGLKYQWRAPANNWQKPGNGWLPVPADAVTYYKPSAGVTDAGKYRCVVSGTCGRDTVYSVLDVGEGPRLGKVSADTIVCVGEDVRLFAHAAGENTLVRWILPDNTVREGEFLNVKGEEQGRIYRYQMEKCGQSPVKGGVFVDVFPHLKDMVVSKDTAVCPGGMAVLQAKIQGYGLKYTWSKLENDGSKRPIAHSASIVINPVAVMDTGVYVVAVVDTCGHFSEEKQVRLSLINEYGDLKITESGVYCPGSSVVLEVTGGKKGLSYEWTVPGGSIVAGAVVKIDKIKDENKGLYICKVTGVCPGVKKETEVGLEQSLKINPSVYSFRECPGENVVFRAEAEGTGITYTWLKNGVALGSSGNSLVLNKISVADAGKYECRVGSLCGDSVLSFQLGVKEQTKIIEYTPDHKYVSETDRVMLYVKAIGENNRYVWKQDGRPVGGNSNYLDLPSLGTDLEGDYVFTCEVEGDCGRDVGTINVHLRKFTYVTQDTVIQVCKESDYTFMVKPRLPECGRGGDTTYRVEYDGSVYSTGAVMPFPAGTKEGLYVWYIKSECGEVTLRMNIEIRNVPKITDILCEGAYARHQDTVMVCEESDLRLWVDAYVGQLFEWKKDGRTIQVGPDMGVVLSNITQEMAGRYSCQVINDCGVDTREVTVLVRKNLKIVNATPSDLKKCTGDAVKLSVEINVDDATFIWKGVGGKNWREESRGYISHYQNLSVKSEEDNGVYYCQAQSVCGTEEVRFNIDVEKPLQLVEVSKDDTVCKGSNVILFARVNVPMALCVWTLPNGSQVSGSELKIVNVTPLDSGEYRYNIISRCVADLSGTVKLSLHSELGKLEVSNDTAVCQESPVVFTSSVEGTGVSYSWRGPGGFVSSGSSVSLPSVTEKNTGIYELSVRDICDLRGFGAVRLSLLGDLKKLKISGDTVVCENSPVSLSVEHEGRASYEWWFKGSKISEEARLTLASVSALDTGVYLCRLKGSCQTKELYTRVGLHRTLSVVSRDSLIRVCPGENVAFHINATGDNMRYVWSKEGNEVGYRESVYNIDEAVPTDAGLYTCDISSVCGNQVVVYELQVKEKTRILSHSPDRFVSEHDMVRLVVRADGENNLFKWSRDGHVLGGNESRLEIDDIGMVDTLCFDVVVKGECGMDSARMIIKVGEYKPIKETTNPDTLCEGSTYTYVGNIIPPTCYGDEVFTYTWKKDGVRLPANGTLLRLEDIKPEDGGLYSCHVAGECGETILSWVVCVIKLPNLVSITEDAFITEGAKHRIDVVATGDRIQYSWLKDGAFYPEKTSSVKFDPVKYEDQGVYRVTAGNICSSLSRESELKVWRKTIITTPEYQNVEACAGTDTVFRVEALGAVGLVYKWYHNWTLLSVPMVNEFVLKGMKVEDAGEYQCVVSGRGGNDTCYIHLNVLPLPKVDLIGRWEICKNDLKQEYYVESLDNRLLYRWNVAGGVIDGRSDLSGVKIVWDGEDEGVVFLNAISSETGCDVRIEKGVEYYPLPEVALSLPDTVGYCLDSLVLDQGYPKGGYYLVNGVLDNVIRFVDKSDVYEVEYHYSEQCASSDRDTVRVAPRPSVVVEEERIITGWCRPVTLGVARHSEGVLRWTGQEPLNTSDVLRPIYTAMRYSEKDILFRVELTDKYKCVAEDSVAISLLPSPQVNLGEDTVVGICQDMVLKADYVTDNFARIEWSPAPKLQVVTENTAQVLEKVEGENRYMATVFDTYGCRGTDTVVVSVIRAPEPESRQICDKDSIVVDCSRYADYKWSDGYEGVVRVLKEPGEYHLEVTDDYGCAGEVVYGVHSLPLVSLPDTLIFEGETMEYKLDLNPDNGPYRIRWQDGSVGDALSATKEGTYSVFVADNLGCTGSDTTFLTVRPRFIAAPDAFLPKSNSENAKFYLKEVNFVNRFEMFIYNRWGELVFKTNEIGLKGGWNGTFKGMDCQAGVYVWVAFSDGKEVGRGTVVLVR